MTTKKLKWIIDKLFKTGRKVPFYDEDSPLDRMLMAKALFLSWISLNYVIYIAFAVFFYFWKETQYTPIFFLLGLGAYSLFVILITLLAGFSYILQLNYYERERQEESPANFNS